MWTPPTVIACPIPLSLARSSLCLAWRTGAPAYLRPLNASCSLTAGSFPARSAPAVLRLMRDCRTGLELLDAEGCYAHAQGSVPAGGDAVSRRKARKLFYRQV